MPRPERWPPLFTPRLPLAPGGFALSGMAHILGVTGSWLRLDVIRP